MKNVLQIAWMFEESCAITFLNHWTYHLSLADDKMGKMALNYIEGEAQTITYCSKHSENPSKCIRNMLKITIKNLRLCIYIIYLLINYFF